MHGLLLMVCKWLESTWWGSGIRTTLWGYPFIQLIHFFGLSLWLGTNVALDLRLLGLGRKHLTAAELRDALFAWNWIGFGTVAVGGFLLFSSIATTYLVNPAFEVKFAILVPVALVWHIVVQQKARVWGLAADVPVAAKLAGLIEILLWLCVITAAVEIPNF